MKLTYQDYQLEVPYDAIAIEEMELKQRVGEHTSFAVTLLLDEKEIKNVIQKDVESEQAVLWEYDHSKKRYMILAAVKLEKVQLCHEDDNITLRLEGCSFTKDFDITKKTRTFYDLSLSYKKIIQTVLSSYADKDFMDHISKGAVIPHLLVQYEETDWEFATRLATHFSSFLLADEGASYGRFHFGMPRLDYGKKLKESDYQITKDIKKYHHQSSTGDNPGLLTHYTRWEVETDCRMSLGEEVEFISVPCQVTGAHLYLFKNQVKWVYTLEILEGVRSMYGVNPILFGMSLEAQIKKRSGNRVRVSFDIDKTEYTASASNQYFTYAIESSSFYCMPEEGSKVHIYFPSNDEKDAIAVHAIRAGGGAGKAENPDNKSFSNVTGSELEMTPTDLSFAADGAKTVCLRLNQDGNVTLTGKSITFDTKDIELGIRVPADPKTDPIRPQNIRLSAGKKIELSKGGELGIQLIDQTFLQAPMIRFDASVKGPSMAIPPEMDLSANDANMMEEINGNAKAQMEAKVAESKQKFGFGAMALAIGAAAIFVAATVLTGGAIIAVAAVAGTAAMAVGVSEMAEATSDYSKSQSGDYSKSYNFMRDTVCGGNEAIYGVIKYGSVLISGAVVAWAIGGPAMLKKALQDGVLDTAMEMATDFLTNGKLTQSPDYYMKSLCTSVVMGGVGGGVSNKFTSSKMFGGMSCGQKWLAKTTLDSAMDYSTQVVTTGDGDFLRSFISNGASNKKYLSDPVDACTGSLHVPAIDLLLPDSGGDFQIYRAYESVNQLCGSLGKGWTTSFESHLIFGSVRSGVELIDFLHPDGHLETFEKTEEGYRNDKGGGESFTLKQTGDFWVVTAIEERKTYRFHVGGKIETITDKNGNKMLFTYHGNCLEKVTTFSGYPVNFTYQNSKVVEIKDGMGRTVQYKYEEDYLTEVIHTDYGITRYTYDETGYLSSITDQNGHTYTKNKFDRKGRVIEEEYPKGDCCKITYEEDKMESRFYYTGSGRTERVKFNLEKLPTHQFYEDGTWEEYGYDAYRNRIYEKDRNGNETRWNYDIEGKLLEEQKADGLSITYEYDKEGNLTATKNSAGEVTLYQYDERGNIIEKKSKWENGRWQKLSYSYDLAGRVKEFTDGMGGITRYEYETAGEIQYRDPNRIISPEKEEYEYEYDLAGRNTTVTTTYGTVEYGYNPLNHVTMRKDGMGNVSRYSYDRMGNLIRFVPPNLYEEAFDNGEGYEYRYDHLDRLISIKDPSGAVRIQERDSEGNVIKEPHPAYTGEVETKKEYDKDNRLIRIHYPDGGTERLFYDANGNIIKRVSPEHYEKVTDDGVGETYEYDKLNRLIKEYKEEGELKRSLCYDLNGNVIKETDAMGVKTLYRYDLAGHLMEKREPAGEEGSYQLTRYTYDANGNKIKEEQGLSPVEEEEYPEGYHRIFFQYDKAGRLICVKDSFGAKASYRYDCLNQKTEERYRISESVEKKICYRYDEAGRLRERREELDGRILSPDRKAGSEWAVTKYGYDKSGNLIFVKTPEGYETALEYSKTDLLLSKEERDKRNNIARKKRYEYDKAGRLIQVRDSTEEKEAIRQYQYNVMDNLIVEIGEDGGSSRYFYDKNQNLIKEIRPTQYKTEGEEAEGIRYIYDKENRVKEIRNPLGERVRNFSYDECGRRNKIRDGVGNEVGYEYNQRGMVTKIHTPESRARGLSAQEYRYDSRGNLVESVDGNGSATKYRLDDWGRITEIETPDEGVERYTYNYAGDVETSTDAGGGTITYRYNSLGKLAERIDQEGNPEAFYYDLEGQERIRIDRNKNRVSRSYNLDGNLTLLQSEEKEGGKSETCSYEYDKKGQLILAKKGGSAYRYTYTPEGRRKSKECSGRVLFSYEYDASGNVIEERDVSGKSTRYVYDKAERLSRVERENGDPLVAYEYDLEGRIRKTRLGNGLESRYGYDGEGNISGLELKGAEGESLLHYVYGYDGNGNCVERMGERAGMSLGNEKTVQTKNPMQKQERTRYQYDNENRLTQYEQGERRECYTYDRVGNRLTKTVGNAILKYTYNRKNQLIQCEQEKGITRYNYDLQGNLIGEESPERSRIYEYSSLNQQSQIIEDRKKEWKYSYDVEGMRQKAEENGIITEFVYNKAGNLSAELTETGEVRSRLVHGNQAALLEKDGNTEETYYYSQDEERSTIFLTNKTGEIRNWYEYDAFGQEIESQEEVENRIRYTGQQYDKETGQYYLRARYYNPVIGRFTQEDEYRGDGLNLYAYCGNNPVKYYDPSGYGCEIKTKTFVSPEIEGNGKGYLLRGDADPYSLVNSKGIPKSHLLDNGDLVPANVQGIYKDRQVTVTEHILGGFRKNAKGNSPYTSFSFNSEITSKYSDNVMSVDISGLRKAIQRGEVNDVAILSPKKIETLIKNDKTQSSYWKNLALKWTSRDSEYLIKGKIPAKYISGGNK